MSYSSLSESDVWHRLLPAIENERARRMRGFMLARDYEAVIRLQTWVEALDWIIAESRPRPLVREDEED